MTKFKNIIIKAIILSIYFLSTGIHASPYFNKVILNDKVFFLTQETEGVIYFSENKTNHSCLIDGWKSEYSRGAGIISTTNDEKAILLANTNSYLLTTEILKCHNGRVTLHKNPVPDFPPYGRVIDLNFEKELYLSLVLMDIRAAKYTAVLSDFHSKKNLITARGFFNKKTGDDEAFDADFSAYGGRISLNGRYVYPAYMYCEENSYPGVWDIEKKRKVVFSSKKFTSEEIEKNARNFLMGTPL